MDIEQAKHDWELNRLKEQREEEERKAELEEDDMLYTYSKEDGMNQVPKRKYRIKEKKRSPAVEPLRKSGRPPRPKQFDLPESSYDGEMKPKIKRGRGRPRKNPVISPQLTSLITVKSGSSPGLLNSHKSGSQAYIITKAAVQHKPLSNGIRRSQRHQSQSDASDIDV